MDAVPFLMVIATGIAVMVLSRMLDRLWAQVVPLHLVYIAIRAPGIVVHECSHVLGCILTGAPVTGVVLLSKDGGSVSYGRPKIPVLGDVVISAAPLFCIPLVLAGLAWLFSAFLGCTFPPFPASVDSAGALGTLAGAVIDLFRLNLVSAFHPWFLLYLYLALSLVLSVAPSNRDLANAAAGLAVIVVAGLLVFWSGIPWAVSLLWQATYVIGTGFALGLAFGLVALAVSLPVLACHLLLRCPR